MKVSKNYYRDLLSLLAEEDRICPILFTGRYKHTNNLRWATFTTIRKYVKGKKTETVCNHINLDRKTALKHVTLTEYQHNRKFYFYGRILMYEHYGDSRAGIVLAEDITESPIWIASQSKGAQQDAELQAAALLNPHGTP